MNDSRKQVDVAVGIVVHERRILVCQRPRHGSFAHYWEFPGGKREGHETLEQCLARELREELAIDAEPIARLTAIEHDYPTARVHLYPFVCNHTGGRVQHLACQTSRWIWPSELVRYRFPPANGPLLREVTEFFTRAAKPSQG